MTLKLFLYLLPKFSRVSFTIVLIPLVNGTLLNVGKRYEDDLRVIFHQWPKLHLGLDAISNQKILKGIYSHSITPCRIQSFKDPSTYLSLNSLCHGGGGDICIPLLFFDWNFSAKFKKNFPYFLGGEG